MSRRGDTILIIISFKNYLIPNIPCSCEGGTTFDVFGSSASGQFDFEELGCVKQPGEHTTDTGSRQGVVFLSNWLHMFLFQGRLVAQMMRGKRSWWALITLSLTLLHCIWSASMR